ncbi:uncharacterized protein KZ484_005626 [Pholidichthys leucotaenia]
MMTSPKTLEGAPFQLSSSSSSSPVESSGYAVAAPDPRQGLLPVTRSSLLAKRLARLRACSGHFGSVTRRKREMIPAEKKDASYWVKRNKNNEAAKRSREKRKLKDLMLEGQLMALSEENTQLRAQLLSLQYHTSPSREESKAAFPCASLLAPTVVLPPQPVHAPALFQARLRAPRHFDGKLPHFGAQSQQSYGTQQGDLSLPEARDLPPGAQRPVEAEISARGPVSWSGATPPPPPAFLPAPDKLHCASAFTCAPQNWLVPHPNHPAVCSSLLLPWRTPYLAPQAVYPGLNLHTKEGPSLETPWSHNGWFSSAPLS